LRGERRREERDERADRADAGDARHGPDIRGPVRLLPEEQEKAEDAVLLGRHVLAAAELEAREKLPLADERGGGAQAHGEPVPHDARRHRRLRERPAREACGLIATYCE